MLRYSCFLILSVVLILFVEFTHTAKAFQGIETRGEIFLGYNGNISLSNVPLSARDIPRHSDDDWLKDYPEANSPIKKNSLSSPTWIFGYRQILSIGFVDLGAQLIILNTSSRVQQNQFGSSDRGTGKSLRYYEVKRGLPANVINFLVGIHSPFIPISEKAEIRFKTGVEFDLESPLNIESGWDRYDKDEVWRTFHIGDYQENRLFFRLDVDIFKEDILAKYLFIQIAIRDYNVNLKPEFQNIKFNKSGPILSTGFGFSFSFGK